MCPVLEIHRSGKTDGLSRVFRLDQLITAVAHRQIVYDAESSRSRGATTYQVRHVAFLVVGVKRSCKFNANIELSLQDLLLLLII